MAAWCSPVFARLAGHWLQRWPARRWLLLQCGLLLAGPLAAQVPPGSPTDSLLRALQTAPTDTTRAKTALRLSAALAATDTARALRYARQALALSQASGFGYGQAHSWLQLSALAIIRNANTRAGRYGALAQATAEPLYRQQPASRLARLLAAIANNRGTVADRRGQYAEAVRSYLRAATYLAPLPEAGRTLLTVYTNLGNSLLSSNQPAQAAYYSRLAAALRPRTGPVPELLPVYLQLARLHLQQAHPDSARPALEAARPLLPAATLYADEYYRTLGQYYRATGQLAAAGRAFGQAAGYAARKGALAYQAKLLFEQGQLAAQALQDLCASTQQASGVAVQLHLHGLETRLPQTFEVELYRLVQELLNNALKHAQARQVLVQLMRHGPTLHLVVEDDGRGFDPAIAGTGVGLRSVQARAHYLGGTLEVQSAPGQGASFSLELRVPE